MLVWAASDYFGARIFGEPANKISVVNFVLLLPAIEPGRGKLGLARDILVLQEALAQYDRTEGGKSDLLKAEHLRVFIVHSERDWANHYLFPVSEGLSLKMPYCSIGACGEPFTPTIAVDEAGEINEWVRYSGRVWNVQADSIISSHSDIYKGRVAGLIWRLISAKELAQ